MARPNFRLVAKKQGAKGAELGPLWLSDKFEDTFNFRLGKEVQEMTINVVDSDGKKHSYKLGKGGDTFLNLYTVEEKAEEGDDRF